jgi:photosystem II stability/assembly factor-like uncharacterized protein
MNPTPPVPEDETTEDLVYAFVAAPGCLPGQRGLVFSARGSGLYRSDDGGQTWQFALDQLGLTDRLAVTAVTLAPNFEQEGLVLAGAPGGLFHSTDAGQTWKALIFPPPPPTVSALAVSPAFAQDETIFAGTMEDGVFISHNGGERWVAWNFGLLDLNVMCLAVSPAFAIDETIFAGTESGLFRSTNGGRAWREVELPFGYEAVLSLAVSPRFTEDETLYAGTEGQGLWVTSDAGATWRRLGEDTLVDPVNAIHLGDEGILAVTGAAAWHSLDGGATWADRLPPSLDGQELSALLAPAGLAPGAPVLVGLIDGSVETIALQ